jgi:outer membrane protein assembly factor BamB
MRRNFCFTLLLAALFLVFHSNAYAQEGAPGWRVAPQLINVYIGEARRLRVLDDNAQELHGATWEVDNPKLAEVTEEDGHAVVNPLARGTVRVRAMLNGQVRYVDIQIWPRGVKMPPGTTHWGNEAIGREIADLAAVPSAEGPNTYALEQTPQGRTYLRAVEEDGFQAWTWLMPEATKDVELVCGDWLGGALISANRRDSFTLYAVGGNGKLRWQHTLAGNRSGHAISTDGIVYILTRASEGSVNKLFAFDQTSGVQKFLHDLPNSTQSEVGIRKRGTELTCASGSITNLAATPTTRLYVNMDGNAYLAFLQSTRTLTAPGCTAGAAVAPSDVMVKRDEKIVLWQVRSDGALRSTVVESARGQAGLLELEVIAPTTAIVTDNMEGILLPVQASHHFSPGITTTRDYIYRLDPKGAVIYKFLLPPYMGPRHDEMVLGGNELGFATRGSTLIAFNVTTGDDLWHWESEERNIQVFAALANHHVMVQTPTALVEVEDSSHAREYAKGHFIMDWHGGVQRKHEQPD